MAKTNGPSLVERHLEKGVLAVSVLILISTLVFWVASSRREIPIGHSVYLPSDVDDAVGKEVERLDATLRDIRPDPPTVPNHLEELKRKILQPYSEDLVRDYIQWQPGQPELEPADEGGATRPTVELAALVAKMVAAEQPVAEIYREVTVPPQEQGPAAGQPARPRYEEVIASHVVGVYPHGRLRQLWQEVLDQTTARPTLIVVNVEAERRHLLPDGRWSAPEPVSVFKLPGQLLPSLPKYDAKNPQEVEVAIAQVAAIQEQIVEPWYPDIVWPTFQLGTWMIHKPKTRVSKMLEEGMATPASPDGRPPVLRGQDLRPGAYPSRPGLYGPSEYPRPASYSRPPGYTRPDDGRLRTAPHPMTMKPVQPPTPTPRVPNIPRTRMDESARPTIRSLDGYRPRAGTPSRTRYQPRPAVRTPTRYEPRPEVPRELQRGPQEESPYPGGYPRPEGYPRPGPVRPGVRPGEVAPAQPEQPQPVLVPAWQEQLAHREGIFELWFHDTKLEEAMTYSYRVRLVVVNPLLGRFRDVKDEADATQVTLKTPWSEWSEPVTVKRPTEFFVAGAFPDRGEVYLDVFTLKGVQRVKQRFTVRRGEPIGKTTKMDLLGLDGEIRSTEVNFKTGAIAVDFDFDKKVQQSSTKMARATTEMLYLDADGKLSTRNMHEDQDSERLEKLRNEVQQAPVVTARRL